jgi:hypothetical protein
MGLAADFGVAYSLDLMPLCSLRGARLWATVEAYGALAPEDDAIRSIYPGAGTGHLAYLEVELRR